MHAAPAVSYPVHRWRGVPALAAVLTSLSLAALWGWHAVVPLPALWAWGGCGLVLVVLAWVLTEWWCGVQGRLHWDGQNWRLEAPGQGLNVVVAPGGLSVALDLQSLVLLSLRHRPRWLWLQGLDDPAQWGDLRRALHLHSAGRTSNP